MRRVSEGLLLGESQLREALEHLLNGLATGDGKRRYSRSPGTSLRLPFQNIGLRLFEEPAGIVPGILGERIHVGDEVVHIPSICRQGEVIE